MRRLGVVIAVAAATWALPAAAHAAGSSSRSSTTLPCASGALVMGQSRVNSCGAGSSSRPRGLSLVPAKLCLQIQELTHDAASGLLPAVTGLMDARAVPTVPLRCAPLQRRTRSTATHHARQTRHTSSAGKPAHAVHGTGTGRPAHVRHIASTSTSAHAAHATSTGRPAHATTPVAHVRVRSSGRHGQHRSAAATGTLHLPAYAPLPTQQASALDAAGMGSLALKFAIVMALLFVCLRVLKAVMPRMSGRRKGAAGAVILHSESIGPKRSMQVLDLGVRILFVGVSGAAMTPLTAVDDPAELAALRARYGAVAPDKEPAPEGPAAHHPSFAQALALSMGLKPAHGERAETPSAGAGATPAPVPLLADGDAALGGALETIRGLRRRVARA